MALNCSEITSLHCDLLFLVQSTGPAAGPTVPPVPTVPTVPRVPRIFDEMAAIGANCSADLGGCVCVVSLLKKNGTLGLCRILLEISSPRLLVVVGTRDFGGLGPEVPSGPAIQADAHLVAGTRDVDGH